MTTSNDDLTPVLRHPADTDSYLWMGGTRMHVVLDGSDTHGQFVLVDQYGVSGDATPLHRHHNDDETFYLLDGEITALAGDREYHVTAGSALFLPRGLPHAFMITSSSARLITVSVPSGFDSFVRAAGVAYVPPAPTTWEFDPVRFLEPSRAAGIEILGPPPFRPADLGR